MARSKGYRAKQGSGAEVAALRAKLRQCRSAQWQRAACIMAQIVELTNNVHGPSGGSVQPRACRYCGYFGHTRQHCQERLRDEEADLERELLRDVRERAIRTQPAALPKKLPWWQRATQEAWFDELGVPYHRDALLGVTMLEGEGGEGMWVRCGGTVKQAVE